MTWLVKITVKLGVLALAALGAQRLMELAKPRLTSFQKETVPAVQDAIYEAKNTVKQTAENLRTDASAAVNSARDDLRPVAEQLKQDVGDAAEALQADIAGSTDPADTTAEGSGDVPPPGGGMAEVTHPLAPSVAKARR